MMKYSVTFSAGSLAALVPVVLIMMSFSGKAAAETATDDVQVYAGLAPILALECSSVNFGAWRVPPGERGTFTKINMPTNSSKVTATVGDTSTADNDVSLSIKYAAPSLGECIATGSLAYRDGSVTRGTVTHSAIGGFLSGTSNNPFATGLNAPTGFNLQGFRYVLEFSTLTPLISSTGRATFRIGGTLTIPEKLISDNYGAYQSGLITITFDDAQVD